MPEGLREESCAVFGAVGEVDDAVGNPEHVGEAGALEPAEDLAVLFDEPDAPEGIG